MHTMHKQTKSLTLFNKQPMLIGIQTNRFQFHLCGLRSSFISLFPMAIVLQITAASLRTSS